MNVREIRSAHFVGIGGINMSAVAKLLLAAGIRVSGSDAMENEQTKILAERGATVTIGQKAENVPAECDVVIYTSAAPDTNPEREEARRRNIPEMSNFQFLGKWTEDKTVILVAGTHGKSTTTAMLGKILESSGIDPTVIVGSKVPGFSEGNLRLGSSDFFVIEGDEYAKHFLEFKPMGVIITNIELDHTDIFPTFDDMKGAFKELLDTIQPGGVLVANIADDGVKALMKDVRKRIFDRNVGLTTFGVGDRGTWGVSRHAVEDSGEKNQVLLRKHALSEGEKPDFLMFHFQLPGMHNAMNAAAAAVMAKLCEVESGDIGQALAAFTGIWRRFELLGEKNGAKIYSDYGHHPTAVAATLAAAKESYPDHRVVLCFQPHHRNRTKNLFLDFVPSFDLADVLILCEIYDVKGRDAKADESISSKDLVDAIIRHDADRGVTRTVEYAPNPAAAIERTMFLLNEEDIVIVMGAGDIDDAIRPLMKDWT